MIGERKYWPAEWVDDHLPPGRGSPSDFIIDVGGGAFYLGYPLTDPDVTEFQKRFFSAAIDPDDVVEFVWCIDVGTVDVTIMPDGDFGHVELPDGETHFWRTGTVTDYPALSLDQFVAEWIASNGKPEKPATVNVSMGQWSKGIPHRFVAESRDFDHRLVPQFVQMQVSEAIQ